MPNKYCCIHLNNCKTIKRDLVLLAHIIQIVRYIKHVANKQCYSDNNVAYKYLQIKLPENH